MEKFRKRQPEFAALGLTLEIDPEHRRVRYLNPTGHGPIYYDISRQGFRRAMYAFYCTRRARKDKS